MVDVIATVRLGWQLIRYGVRIAWLLLLDHGAVIVRFTDRNLIGAEHRICEEATLVLLLRDGDGDAVGSTAALEITFASRRAESRAVKGQIVIFLIGQGLV